MAMGKYREALQDAKRAASLGYPDIRAHIQKLIELSGPQGNGGKMDPQFVQDNLL